jgi:hypothetical protein
MQMILSVRMTIGAMPPPNEENLSSRHRRNRRRQNHDGADCLSELRVMTSICLKRGKSQRRMRGTIMLAGDINMSVDKIRVSTSQLGGEKETDLKKMTLFANVY